MTASPHRAVVVNLATHAATSRHRALRGPAQPSAEWVLLAEQPGDPRLAARIARREARAGIPTHAVRVVVFLRLVALRRLWRRCCRHLSPSRRVWVSAKPTAPFASPDGAARWPKRSPRPVGAHPRRDFLPPPARRRPFRDGGRR
ncbi:MAG: hypothetical protein KGN77_15265 [Xanthomonadaceae bacterium]|nr:hypothetical protein [Xanthomonadaceae bacterium]